MKKSVSIFILMLIMSTAYCWAWAQSTTDKVPILIPMTKDAKAPYLEIPTSCVKDTTKIMVDVRYVFDQKFGKNVKITSTKDVRIGYFRYYPQSVQVGDNPVRDSCIIRTCEAQFKTWTKNQPFSKMYNVKNNYGRDRIMFLYRVYLIPTKH